MNLGTIRQSERASGKLETRPLVSVIVFFVLLCGAGASASRAEGPQAERPMWEEGDMWLYEKQVEGQLYPETEVLKVLGRTRFRNQKVYVVEIGLMQAYYDKDLNYLATFVFENQVASVEPAIAFFNWPLEVGKQWSQKAEYRDKRKGDDHVQRMDNLFEVVGYEAVTVPAGTFQSFKLKRTSRGGQGFDEYWYAPQVKNLVKRVSLIPSGEKLTKVSFELKSYEVKKGGEKKNSKRGLEYQLSTKSTKRR
jgi:hypothetical protein